MFTVLLWHLTLTDVSNRKVRKGAVWKICKDQRPSQNLNKLTLQQHLQMFSLLFNLCTLKHLHRVKKQIFVSKVMLNGTLITEQVGVRLLSEMQQDPKPKNVTMKQTKWWWQHTTPSPVLPCPSSNVSSTFSPSPRPGNLWIHFHGNPSQSITLVVSH